MSRMPSYFQRQNRQPVGKHKKRWVFAADFFFTAMLLLLFEGVGCQLKRVKRKTEAVSEKQY